MSSVNPEAEGSCPSPETLHAVLKEALAEECLADVTRHLGHCESCQCRMAKLSGSATLSQIDWDREAISDAPSEEMEALIERMKSVGRMKEEEKRSEDSDLSFLDPSDDPKYLGQLGKYQVTRLIARGGMGIVLEALEAELERVVAIKVLAPALAASKDGCQGFMREAKAAASLEHENILPIYAVHQTGPLPYLVMPFIKGMTLDERISKGPPLSKEELISIALKVARGLEFAHRQGVIHRDIKPANILLDAATDRVLLADFGLARVVGDRRQTSRGVISGTPQYMAPEQTQGGEIDHRSDLFSLGSVLYHMAAGKPPFRANTVVQIMRQIAESEPDRIAQSEANVPSWFKAVIRRLLAKRPEDRIQETYEIVHCLNEQVAPPAAAASRNTPIPWLWVTLGVMVIAVGLFMANQWRVRSSTGPFQIEGATGRYETLLTVIDKATDGDVILVNHSAKISPVRIENKRLTLRAGAEGTPTLVSTKLASASITSNSALALEGLTFTQSDDEADRYEPAIVMSSAPLTVRNCRFVRNRDRYWGHRSSVSAIHLIDCPEVDVSNTLAACRRSFFIYSENTQALDQKITITNSTIVGERGVSFNHPRESQTDVVVDSSTFFCRRPFIGDPAHSPAELNFQVSNSVFSVKFDLIQMPKSGRAGITVKDRRMSWAGQNNLYTVKRSFISFFNGPRSNAVVADFNAWQRFAVETGSQSIPSPIMGSLIDFENMSEMKPADVALTTEWQYLSQRPGIQPEAVGPGDARRLMP